MKSNKMWRLFYVGSLSLCLSAWVGVVGAANWANPELLLSVDDLQ